MRSLLNLIFIVTRSLKGHIFSSVISVISIAFAASLVMSVFVIKDQSYEAFTAKNLGYDAVLGAKGSELQLVLNSVFFVEDSPGNISWRLYQDFKAEPAVEKAVPYALGDSYESFRIVGTTEDIFDKLGYEEDGKYRIRGKGELFNTSSKEAVIGSFVAQETELSVGSMFKPAHGMDTSQNSRHESEFEVVGVLSPTNTPVDRVIWVPIEQFYRTEGHVLRGSGAVYKPKVNERIPDSYKEVSAVMLKLKDPTAGFVLKKKIEDNNIKAALAWPVGSVIADLFNKLGWFRDILGLFSYVVVFISIGTVLASIYNTINNRRREFALMRALGAGKYTLFNAVLLESTLITFVGSLAALCITFLILSAVSYVIKSEVGIVLDVIRFHYIYAVVPAVMILLGMIAGIIPAIKAYSTQVAENLNPLS